MADTPTSEAKAEVEDTAHGHNTPDRDRRRGDRKGKGKGKSRDKDARARDGERRGDEGRTARKGRGGGKDRDDRRRGRGDRSDQPLTAGLFAGVADREMPCRIAGCTNTWTWYGTQQIRSLGKPEPKRMCAEHLAQLEGIEDREMPCRNSWCTNTWTWSRAAQLYQRERQEKLKPPHRLCEQCFEEEKTTDDTQIACKIPECRNSWTWSRQAQLRHRAWVRRQQAKLEAEAAEDAALEAAEAGEREAAASEAAAAEGEAAVSEAAAAEGEAAVSEAAEAAACEAAAAEGEAAAAESAPAEIAEAAAEPAASKSKDEPALEPTAEAGEAELDAETSEAEAKPGKKRKRRRKRKRKIHDGPPEKLCERCFERLNHLEPIEIPCKVHGCTNTWTWERDGQLRAWAALDGRDNVTELPQPPRRMCNSCFEFVRAHGDREVVCGRPGCEKTWTYKTGAQLQDFLAGRSQDPIRLCDDCSRSQFIVSSSQGVQMPPGAEVMPCQVAGCGGSWVYTPGMQLSSADPDAEEPPADRMCDDCREQRGAPGRDPRRVRASSAQSPSPADDEAPSEPPASEPAADEPKADEPAGEIESTPEPG